ncbi:MAG TPA: xanthine dehydrogenase family protein molybdopterin-binding subunit [Candidatus Entotheonella sp.]|jgi:CO/xanthine dehydrogenase Mo-binding subunit
MATESLRVVGTSPARLDARDKVTGRTRYTTDLAMRGMVHAKIWRSPLPHARVERIETQDALAAPGVLAVLTAEDVSDCDPYYGTAFKDQPLLAIDRVRYAGEPVAVVIAATERQAMAAVALLDVTLTELPAALDTDAALAPHAPLVHETIRPAGHFRDLSHIKHVPGTNICHHQTNSRGDIEQGWAEADAVFDDTFQLPPIYHYAMEPHAALAKYESQSITVWSATQHPFPVRKELAEIFGLPLAAVQVIVPPVGGAYGSKCYTKIEPLTVACARQVRRPVRLALSVSEACHTITRHGASCRVTTGVRHDGTITARQFDIVLNTGAYADVGPRVATRASFVAPGPYRVPHVRVDCRVVYTHTVPAGAYRGYGVPQVTWAAESQLDRIADRLGLDPVAFRQRNLLAAGEEFSAGDLPMDAELAEGLRRTAAAINWQSNAKPHSTQGAVRRGKGVACAFKDGGIPHSVSTAVVRVHADGSVTVFTGAIEHGQGSATILAQVAAETLGVDLEHVSVTEPDTALTPYDQGTSASRTTTLMGRAVYAASLDAREQLMAMAADLLGVPAASIRIQHGVLQAEPAELTFGEAISQHFGYPGGEVIGKGEWQPSRSEGSLGGAAVFWEIGMGGAEVEVDEETGAIKVLQYVSMADVGRAIHQLQCEAQDEGGAMQGLGSALFEALIAQDGQLLNPNLVDYRVPTFEDLPEVFGTVLLQNGNGPGPYGAKGVGEGGIFCVAPAIGNAIARATGVRLYELPLTPERVWRALRNARRAEKG